MRADLKKNLNVPNLLTLIRLLLIPVYWWLMMVREDEYSALIIFVVASATDLLDGYIARRFDLITDLGKLFDPLADKLMVLSVMLSLVLKGILPLLILVIILLKESLMIVGSAMMLHYQVVVSARSIGKIAQFVVVMGLLLCFFRERFAAFPLHLWVLWLGVALTLSALIYYGTSCIRAIRSRKLPPTANKED